MKIQFILTSEGSSDLNLLNHIENILIEEGFSEVSGIAPDLGLLPNPVGRSVREKIAVLAKLHNHADVIFVHRDADNSGLNAREQEIAAAAVDIISLERVIPIIPVVEFETWLLTDHEAIKRVAGNTQYKGTLNCIPAINRLEGAKNTKEILLEALCQASETQGERLRKFKKQFPEMRARLAYDLNPKGSILKLSSYQIFRERVLSFSQKALNKDHI